MILFMSCFAAGIKYTVMNEQTWALPHLTELVEGKNDLASK